MVQILDEAIENDMKYDPAPFKKTKPCLSKSELITISIEELAKDTRFRSRAANSLLFYHLGNKVCEIVEMHSNRSAGHWTPAATLASGHNQACERLIGDLKRSNDIAELVTLP